MSTRPTKMSGICGDQSFTAHVNPEGTDWVIEINHAPNTGCGKRSYRYRSTIAARPDNGALGVAQLLRREFNITGTFKTE